MVMVKERKKCSLCEKEKPCLQHLKHDGKYCHLCSSCVLITHCDMYYPHCLEDCGSYVDALLKCSNCLHSVHVDCYPNSTVSNPNADPFRCLHCLNPNSDLIPFSVLSSNCPAKKLERDNVSVVSPQKFVDAKLVLSAARMTSIITHRIAREATSEAQRRAKQVVQLKREATEALHHALDIADERNDKLQRGLAKSDGAIANPGNINSKDIMREEEQMVKATSPAMEIEGQDKEDFVQNEDPVETREEEKIVREEHIDKVGSPPHEIVEDTSDSQLHSTKFKSDSILQVLSWIYNELIGLKKKVETMQHNQDTDQAKISQLEVQMGDIPKKLKDYEKNIRTLIKESGTKMEQVISSICATAASLGKRANEEIISFEGPSKRTR